MGTNTGSSQDGAGDKAISEAYCHKIANNMPFLVQKTGNIA
jgi:hypothetical protein